MFWGDDKVFVSAFDTSFNPSLFVPYQIQLLSPHSTHFWGEFEVEKKSIVSVRAKREK